MSYDEDNDCYYQLVSLHSLRKVGEYLSVCTWKVSSERRMAHVRGSEREALQAAHRTHRANCQRLLNRQPPSERLTSYLHTKAFAPKILRLALVMYTQVSRAAPATIQLLARTSFTLVISLASSRLLRLLSGICATTTSCPMHTSKIFVLALLWWSSAVLGNWEALRLYVLYLKVVTLPQYS